MGKRLSHSVDIHEQVIRALLVNGPAVMEIAEQLELSPREVRNILHETLLQLDETEPQIHDRIPVMAQTPHELSRLASGEFGMLFGSRHKHS